MSPSWEEFARKQMTRRLDAVVQRLRDLTEQVERDAKQVDRVGERGIKTYAQVATTVQHTVLWGLANLNLDGLTGGAYDADQARLTEQFESERAEGGVSDG